MTGTGADKAAATHQVDAIHTTTYFDMLLQTNRADAVGESFSIGGGKQSSHHRSEPLRQRFRWRRLHPEHQLGVRLYELDLAATLLSRSRRLLKSNMPPGLKHGSQRHGEGLRSAGFGVASTRPCWVRTGSLRVWQSRILSVRLDR